MFEKIIRKLFGPNKDEVQRQILSAQQTELTQTAKKKKPAERKRKALPVTKKAELTPKEIATKKKEPWVDVMQTHINKDNLRNGFFELDWNEYFILQLKQEGYGFEGDPEEEIVDRWFRDLARNILASEGQQSSSVGLINLPANLTE